MKERHRAYAAHDLIHLAGALPTGLGGDGLAAAGRLRRVTPPGQYTHALPVLRRHHFVATFFIMTVVLGKPGWLTRGQVRALDRAGMTIGAHTWDHKPVPQYTGTDWQTEITAPTHDLQRLIGHRIRLFAYPDGLHDNAAIPYLWSAGLRAAFQLAERLDRHHPLWTIRRTIAPEISGKQLLDDMRKDF
jgi:peptidoglycan/xylan/chitin deacetylase (PgdA/CDA1 family)